MNLKKGKFKIDCVWVAGCTIQNVENEVSPDKDILENGFSRQ